VSVIKILSFSFGKDAYSNTTEMIAPSFFDENGKNKEGL
jgi:hypothetical protein